MTRFVILEHDHPKLHWDLMLEAGEVLQTWRLAQPPQQPGCEIEATALGDHRRLYLDYEGPISGNRGTVKRWDSGVFAEQVESRPARRHLLFEGKRVRAVIQLERITGAEWRLRWLPE